MPTNNEMIERALDNWSNAKVLSDVASFFENASRLELALRFAQRSIEVDPTYSYEPYLCLAFTHMRDNASTEEAARAALMLGWQNTSSAVLRAWLTAMSDDETSNAAIIEEVSKDTSFEAQAAIANALSWRGKLPEAYKVLKDFPDRYEHADQSEWGAYCSLMMFSASNGMDIDCETLVLPHIKRLIQLRPDDISYRTLLMRYYTDRKEVFEAIRVAEQCLEVFPDDETTMYALAGLYEKDDNPELAMYWCTRAIGAKQNYVSARCRLAGYYEKQGKMGMADKLMFEIPRVNREYNYGIMRLALYLQRTGRHEDAKHWFEHANPKLRPWELHALSSNEYYQALKESV